jgi:hypothetical protein
LQSMALNSSPTRLLASPKRRLSAFPSPMSTGSVRTRTLTGVPRTLFLDEDSNERRRALQREDQRIAPPAPIRKSGINLQRQVTTRAVQQQQQMQTRTHSSASTERSLLGSPPVYDQDDLPSPFLKKTYSLKALSS